MSLFRLFRPSHVKRGHHRRSLNDPFAELFKSFHTCGNLRLLVDPVELSRLPAHELLLLEPQVNLLLGALDGI
jgi:hypothetical protein